MKSKKRHQTSSDDSEESDASAKSSSTSEGSESEASSESLHRHKKKRKRADSSDSESDSDDHKRKKRKHKKKKKKHGKKKRRSHSVPSISVEEISMSEGEISSKNSKKRHRHKHKHSKRAGSSSVSEEEERDVRRLHSVVKERRASSEEGSQPSRTYYERDYRNRESRSREQPEYDREREVQRFYRGSSKDRSYHSERFSEYDREHIDKYASYQDKNYKTKYQSAQHGNSQEEYHRNQRNYDAYKRHQRYEERKSQPEYHSRTREEYHGRTDTRGYNNQNRFRTQYEERGLKRPDYVAAREYQNRRPPQDHGHYQEKEYPDKRERYQENYPDRQREPRRDNRAARPEKPAPPQQREYVRSPEERYKERSRHLETKEDRPDERYRGGGGGREERKEPKEDRRDPREDRRDPRDDRREPKEDRRERDGRGDEKRDRPREVRRDDRPDRPDVKDEQRPKERKSRFDGGDSKEYSWGKTEVKIEGVAPDDKEKPNFGLSGKLTADVNTVNGVVIKYSEPDDAKQPKRRWRFYPFKGDKALPILYIHRQSAFLIGRDKKVVDICLEHPSVSKQHAALQYRATPFDRADGTIGRRVRPYIIDLESANGTFVNNKKIEARRYVELLERDVVKFGFSAREYVLLHENSKDDAQDDDNQEPNEIGATVTTTDKIKQEKRAMQEAVEDGE